MKAFFGLTAVETELMELFWNAKGPLSFREIMEYITSVLKKTWKKQTLNTYLSNLQKAGLVRAERSNYHYRYFAACTKIGYIQQWTQDLVENFYGNSIGNFVEVFARGEKLSEEEAQKLKKLF